LMPYTPGFPAIGHTTLRHSALALKSLRARFCANSRLWFS
jgi:hypothetical protein